MEPLPPAAPSTSCFTWSEMGSVEQQQDCCIEIFPCAIEQMYEYPASSSHRLLPCSPGCPLAPNHPIRATKQLLRPCPDFQPSPLLQQARPERAWGANRTDVLSTPWADSEEWLELLSFPLRCGRERAALSSRVLHRPEKWCLNPSAERFCSTPLFVLTLPISPLIFTPVTLGFARVNHYANAVKAWSANYSAARHF